MVGVQLYDDMRCNGVVPTVEVFAALLMAAVRARSMELGQETVLLMEQVRIQKKPSPYGRVETKLPVRRSTKRVTWRCFSQEGVPKTERVLSLLVHLAAVTGNVRSRGCRGQRAPARWRGVLATWWTHAAVVTVGMAMLATFCGHRAGSLSSSLTLCPPPVFLLLCFR